MTSCEFYFATSHHVTPQPTVTKPIQVLNNYNRESELSRYMKRRNAAANARALPAPLHQLTTNKREYANTR